MENLRLCLKAIFCLLIFLSIHTGCTSKHLKSDEAHELNFAKLDKEFKNPSKEFRSAPLWVWNTKVTKEDIDRMLSELKEQGFGGAFVHPRPGLITEYLSDEWFDLYKYSVEAGKKLDMDIWIYDENSYPSGFAGGHVPDQMPESYNQGQGLDISKKDILTDADSAFLYLKKEGDAYKDITASVKDYIGVKGDYCCCTKTYYKKGPWYAGFSYVDLLYPGVTEKFIDITMSGYEKTFKDELGTVVKGVFTDEPHIGEVHGIRWTPDLFDVFQKRWGYDLKTVLPLLVEEEGNWKQVRHNYQETLLDLFIERWSKPWHNYCEQHNLKWTGHYWEHGWPVVSQGPDNMAMYAWHQMPAIDMLFNQFNEESTYAQFGNVRSVKELRSVANQMGYIRTLSETYGGGGWEVTFEDFKRLGDWEYVLGVNFMNQHLSHMTISGARKYDYPPVFTSHSPWWNDYKSQNDYFARLSLVLSQGEQLNDILVIEPTTTAWLYNKLGKRNDKLNELGNNFSAFVTKLEKKQVEYDLGSENIIKNQCSVNNGLFVVGKRSYKKVVIAPMTENLDAKTVALLQRFVQQGGEILAFAKPTLVDGKEDDKIVNLLENTEIIDLTDDIIATKLKSEKIAFSNIVGNSLYHQRRTYDDGELLFFVNSSLEETCSADFTIEGKNLIQPDAMDGNTYSYAHSVKGNSISAKITLPPAGSLLLFASKSETGQYPDKHELVKNSIIASKDSLKVERVRDNVLAIDFCDLYINNRPYKDLHVASASDSLYNNFGFLSGNPWNTSVQFRNNTVARDTFKTGDIRVQYKFTVADNIDMSKMRLVAEQPNIWKASINGTHLKAIEGKIWLDNRFAVYEIGSLIKQGVNVVELSVSPMSVYAEIEPVYILGDFALQSSPKAWAIKAPVKQLELGSWKNQGQPLYSWEVAYSKTYNISDLSPQYSLQLKEWKGTLAEVFVNNKKVGIIAYQPFQFNLSPNLIKGDNKVEVSVVGSLKNLLGPHHQNPAPGLSSPWTWKKITKQISGSEYSLLDYGLMQDFDVYTSVK